MSDVNLYTLTASSCYTGGMALVAASSKEEAVKFCNANPSMRRFQFSWPQLVGNTDYQGPKGVIEWGAYEE